MKAKSQPLLSSEDDAKDRLVAYVYEYLEKSGAKRAAQLFLQDIGYGKQVEMNDPGPGFLLNWWCVFWDLYCATPEKRGHIEASQEARAFHDFNMRSSGLSPSLTQMSPQSMGQPYVHMPTVGGPHRYNGPLAPHPSGPAMRGGQPGPSMGPMPRLVGPGGPPMMGGGPGMPPSMMSGGSPRYVPPPGHLTPGSSSSSGGPMSHDMGMNRMTPTHHSSSPRPNSMPPNGMTGNLMPLTPLAGPPPTLSMGGQVGPIPPGGGGGVGNGGPPMQQMPPRGGGPGSIPPQAQQQWQSNFSNVNSPAEMQGFMSGPPGSAQSQQQGEFGGMMMGVSDGGMMELKPGSVGGNGPPQNQQQPPSLQQEEYHMPGAYGQPPPDGGDQAGSEIMRLKESLEGNESEQAVFNSLDFVP